MPLLTMLKLPPPVDPREFEAMVETVLRERYDRPQLVRFGRPGQRQDGIDGLDPLATGRDEFVWQATLTQDDAMQKLTADLKKMDGRRFHPGRFVFVVGRSRDAAIQAEIKALSSKRRLRGQCQVEVLFWEDIAQAILDDQSLLARWYPEFVGRPRLQSTRSETRALLALAELGRLTDEVEVALWHLLHLARIGGAAPDDLRAIQAARSAARAGAVVSRWANGLTARIGRTWSYPNGQTACIGDHWNYPSGQAACIGDYWNYPNGQTACMGCYWSWPDGRSAGSEGDLVHGCLSMLPESEHDAIASALIAASGQRRRLGLVALAWETHPVVRRARRA